MYTTRWVIDRHIACGDSIVLSICGCLVLFILFLSWHGHLSLVSFLRPLSGNFSSRWVYRPSPHDYNPASDRKELPCNLKLVEACHSAVRSCGDLCLYLCPIFVALLYPLLYSLLISSLSSYSLSFTLSRALLLFSSVFCMKRNTQSGKMPRRSPRSIDPCAR